LRIDTVILGMGSDEADVEEGVSAMDDEAVSVPTDVEDDAALLEDARCWEAPLYVRRRLPVCFFRFVEPRP